jgi:hypothetical protein
MSKINIEYQPELQVWSQDLDKKYISMDNRRKYEHPVQPYSIQSIIAEPGDVILAHVSEDLDVHTVNDIWKQLKVAFPNNDVLIANEYILKGLTIVKPATGKVNEHYRRETSDILDDWLRRNVEFNI